MTVHFQKSHKPARKVYSGKHSIHVIAIGIAIILSVSGATAVALGLLRQHQLDERQRAMTFLAALIAEHVDHTGGNVHSNAENQPADTFPAGMPGRHAGNSAIWLRQHDGQKLVENAQKAAPNGGLSRPGLEEYFRKVASHEYCSVLLLDQHGSTLAGISSQLRVRGAATISSTAPLQNSPWSVSVQCSRAQALLGWTIGTIGGITAVGLLDLAIILLIWLGIRQLNTAKSVADQAARQARTDLLTGLPNRLAFQERMSAELVHLDRAGGQTAILMLDLDGFKDINDGLGHATGDELLKLAATRMRDRLRRGEFLARLGGDEFAVIQSPVDQKHEALSLGRYLIEAFNAPFHIKGADVRLGVSVGAAFALRDGKEMSDLMEKADLALYASKAERLGRVVFYHPSMSEAAALRMNIQTDLANALDRKQLELYYQPILDLEQREICGFEALMRWHHPKRGLISPDQFIPILEANGWISRAGEFALRSACQEASTWPRGMSVAVNLSPIQCHDPTLPNLVAEILANTGLAPQRLELEITETASLDAERGAFEILRLLRKMGVRVVLDDFGTGFGSFARLNSFPFDKLKIDKSFISQLGDDGGEAIVRTTIALARNLEMSVTAEGVETAEQLAFLRRKRCTQVQGYIISAPRRAETLQSWLTAQSWRELALQAA